MKKLVLIIVLIIAFLGIGAWYIQSNSSESIFENALDSKKPFDLTIKKKAPEFTGINSWLNSEPLTMESLKGKVVLIDFWTYSCINCIRTLPYVTEWYEKYKDKGFVVIGVHTPEFAFEKDRENVADALTRFKINYPVAQDNSYATWNAYDNHYWPAHYLIDQEGNIVDSHFGEGAYGETEKKIQELLGVSDMKISSAGDTSQFRNIKTPEIYFGLSRLEYFSSPESPDIEIQKYSIPEKLRSNTFALEGEWKFDGESVELVKNEGKITLNFSAGKVHMVAESEKGVMVEVYIDGKKVREVEVTGSELYTLFDSDEYSAHILELKIPDSGFRIFTFTFG